MKIISHWASRHVWLSRLSIFVIYLALNILGLFTGDALHLLDIHLPSPFAIAACVLFLTAFVFYPSKKQKSNYRNFYRTQKTCDFLLGFTTFCMIIYFGNATQDVFPPAHRAHAAFIQPVPPIEKQLQERPVKKLFTQLLSFTPERSSLKTKVVRKLIQLRQHYKNAAPAGKVLFIILGVLVAFGLLYLLAGLACAISCSGSEGAAIALAILGTALIVFLFIRFIRGLNRKYRKQKDS